MANYSNISQRGSLGIPAYGKYGGQIKDREKGILNMCSKMTVSETVIVIHALLAIKCSQIIINKMKVI